MWKSQNAEEREEKKTKDVVYHHHMCLHLQHDRDPELQLLELFFTVKQTFIS